MLDRILKAVLGVSLAVVLGFGTFGVRQASAQAPKQEKHVKDQGEYDLYNSVVKETDLTKKLALTQQWKDKYPDSDYKNERTLMELQAYSQIAATPMQQPKPTPEAMDAAEKAANQMVSGLDTYFAATVKPPNVSDADWDKAKNATQNQAHTTLGWISMQKKDFPKAETEFKQVLQMSPNNAQVSYWLGTVIAYQVSATKDIKRTPEALFEFARAASLTGDGALNAQSKQATETYLEKAYKGYHGEDAKGLQDLKDLAAKSALPPDGFTIEDVNSIEKKKYANEEEFNKAHPDLALWRQLKTALTAADGQTYFNDKVKGAAIPQVFKGKLVSMKPETNPKEIVVAVDDPTGDATLRFETALRGKADPGTEIDFEGVPESFTASPYMLTFVVERPKLKGWPAAPAAPARRPAARRRPAAK